MEFERIADIKRLNFIVDALKARFPEGSKVLDVGCGNGIISRNVGAAGFTVKGIDVSEKAISKAAAVNTLSNVTFELRSAEELVADGYRYDAVICSEVLEHLQEPGKLIRVLHEVLNPDGILIVTVPNGKGPREVLITKPVISLQKKNNWMWKSISRIKAALGYSGTTIQSSADDLTHVHFFTKRALKKLADENNFKIIRFGKTNFIDDVFPFSFFSRKIKGLQKLDCSLAEILPHQFTGGFVTVWEKIKKNG
ncbi:MAG: methyltransferase domain-containing protein [Chitinophagaceae bacterium]|nr:methyltransferase domain-containing protein [Chitinophagaceae bacterium]MCW5928537.1 methyltransferase domain-containing protein [Chitinophagaceae bacterium]